MTRTAFIGAKIHDGDKLHDGMALLCDGPLIGGLVMAGTLPAGCREIALDGGIIAPGFVDLQVNGGGGVMFNDDQSIAALEAIAAAHAATGTRALLPTLITDTPDRSRAAIAAVAAAVDKGVPGIAGIHLEGPHLSMTRKGAHDPALIRTMTADDLSMIAEAAGQLPAVMLTVAPESVSIAQVAALAKAGVIVSLGHTDADFDTAQAYFAAGARCATHLFNAMSQLGNREPGMVGAVLDNADVAAGLIADGVHVHPATIRAALRAKTGQGRIFLVTDAMASVGSDLTEFVLNGRTVHRQDGTLRLADGTLAGADIDMPRSIATLVDRVGLDIGAAIAMATSIPAGVIGQADRLGLTPGRPLADLVWLDRAFAAHRLTA
jgi:N-acetylglucosamine-6-phosphate deacetylase